MAERFQEDEGSATQSPADFVLREYAPYPYQSLDESGSIRAVNDAWLDLLGYDREAVLGTSFEEFLAADHAADFQAQFDAFLDDGRIDQEFEMVHADGHPVLVSYQGRVEYDATDGVRRTHCQLFDVTKRREYERGLETERDRAERFFETAGTMMVVFDVDGCIEQINGRGCDVLGYDRPELIGEDWFETVVPDDVEADVDSVFESLLADDARDIDIHENQVITSDGERRTIKWHNTPLYDADGTVSGVLSSGSDVTERRDRERALEASRTAYEDLFDAIDDAVFVVDFEGNFIAANETARQRLGYDEAELRELTLWDVDADEYADEIDDRLDAVESSTAEIFESVHVTKSGDRIPVEITTSTVEYFGEQAVLSVARDVTERRQRERELRRENERLDEFASVVSHDLRNPLNVAQGRTGILREHCDSEHTSHLQSLADALDRMEAIIEDTLTLAREGDAVQDTDPVNGFSLVGQCWEMVDTAEADLEVDAFTIAGDRGRLRHLFENLIRNAVEHGGSDVTIHVGQIDDGIVFEDTGPGIPADERATVFEPGYSANTDGTGFGLAIVRRIAEAHGWDIHVTDGPDGGARFEFTDVEFVS